MTAHQMIVAALNGSEVATARCLRSGVTIDCALDVTRMEFIGRASNGCTFMEPAENFRNISQFSFQCLRMAAENEPAYYLGFQLI